MVRQKDGQKFIGESRAPRVQIEYDVEIYGSQKKVELPFVAGVMADLSGDNVEPLGPVEERRFLEIDVENFDDRMAQIAPSLSYHVKNVLTNDGTLIPIDLTFTSMDSFEPAEVVRRIPELSTLLDARSRLKELLTYMDGKAAAEDLIHELLRRQNVTDDDTAAVASAPSDAAPDNAPSGEGAPNQEVK
ncbi:type VI secretion protein [Burkholderia singularis]|uniref:Type VI secretion protein n=1 Tax=Burkholderia singularis TaxID=1503053 RepID=A0A118DP03_9BURK|nr:MULTISPECIES: type VI secretion system contractile sheath small subunit [Burkholderia]AOK29353.1 type VI secretion protein [Burkholderia sp. Bp7605]KVE27306.1 type VI secretion protein [Burkholderia singularis]